MINKSTIIEQAFIRLGEVGTIYNDNRSEQYKVATILLDGIIDTIAVDNNFLFNATTVTLSKAIEQQNELGEYRYNMPIDFLNAVRLSNGARIEGEFIYSTEDSVKITYCRKININELPNYLRNLLIYSLASSLADAYSAYENKKQLMLSYYNAEVIKIMNVEGLRFTVQDEV